jgi:tetratricopeptide (TPR) repeat protein
MGSTGLAMSIVSDIQKDASAGRYAYLASERVKRYSSAGGVAVSADQMMTSADAYIDKEQYRDALIALRRCVEAATTDDEKKKFLLPAWYKTGQCLAGLKRHYEAAGVYELVCKLDPKHDLAGKACSEIARCYFQEFAISGDKRDEDAKKKAIDHLASVHPQHPAAINIPYMQAEELETKGDLRAAAQRYLQVSDKAEAYEAALVRGGYCYRVAATTKWAQTKDKKVQTEAADDLKLAEAALQKFLALTGQPDRAPKEPALVRARANLIFLANEQLAHIYMHESIGRAQDGLNILQRGAKELSPDDDRLARNWGMQVKCMLELGQSDQAVAVLESMFVQFPVGLPIAQACKSVGIHLDTVTQDMIKGQKDPTVIAANLKRISKYYRKWIDEGITRGMRVTTPDVIAVADALYLMAKRLNGLDENKISFLDLQGQKISERGVFEDAANVLVLLLNGQRLSDSQKIGAMTRLARCYSFSARDVQDWDKAKEQYDNIVKAFKLVDPVTNNLNVGVLQQHPELLGVYLELGYVYHEIGIGAGGERFQLDNAYGLFSNVARAAAADSEPWWVSKYMVLKLLYARGKDSDLKMAHLGLKNLEENFPDFDKGRFHIKERLLELKSDLAKNYRDR